MRRIGIGGALSYERLAQLNRPQDPAALSREAKRLYYGGLLPRDIAIALRISIDEVMNLLEPAEVAPSDFGPSPVTAVAQAAGVKSHRATSVSRCSIATATSPIADGSIFTEFANLPPNQRLTSPAWSAALTETPTPPASAAAQHAVGRLHASGATAKEIGAELSLSVATVLTILANIATTEPTA